MQPNETGARRVDTVRQLLKRSHTMVQKTRANILRARAVTIEAHSLAQAARSTRYENHLIRGLKR